MMAETCLLAEAAVCHPPLYDELRGTVPRPTETAETVAIAAVAAAVEQNASAILVLSTSGNTARLLSKYRPPVPILTVTRNEQTARQTHLHRGVYPFWYPEPRGIESHQWQTDVSACVLERVLTELTAARRTGRQPHPLRPPQRSRPQHHQDRHDYRRRPGLEGRSRPHEHPPYPLCPDRPCRPPDAAPRCSLSNCALSLERRRASRK